MVFGAHNGGSEIQAPPEFQWPLFVCLFWLLSLLLESPLPPLQQGQMTHVQSKTMNPMF